MDFNELSQCELHFLRLNPYRYSAAANCIRLRAGVDEVGRGPLAGPVTASAIVLPPKFSDPRIKDSKKLTHGQREELFEVLQRRAIACAVVSLGPRAIERLNIREAARTAMSLAARAVEDLIVNFIPTAEVSFLVDGNVPMPGDFRQETVIGGDDKVLAISAASIMAKVVRDRRMAELDKQYPGYGFAAHKGYGTTEHLQRIVDLGPSVVHRATFAGVREYLSSGGLSAPSVERAQVPLFRHSKNSI